MTDDWIEECDPGIREVVRKLVGFGYETIDSGDGVSKPDDWYASGYARDHAHVVVKTTVGRMVQDTETLFCINRELFGGRFNVDLTYSPGEDPMIDLWALSEQEALDIAAGVVRGE